MYQQYQYCISSDDLDLLEDMLHAAEIGGVSLIVSNSNGEIFGENRYS